jgi:hypothetical protein
MQIENLETDVSNGILLLNLLEVIGGDSIFSVCKRCVRPRRTEDSLN